MSSTYSVGKTAAAIRDQITGAIYYLLFEQTYEANVYPHTPHWSAIYFGQITACMRRIVEGSADCVGGMLKGKGGDITASAYIGQWRRALAEPIALRENFLSVEFGTGMYRVAEEKRNLIAQIMQRHGFDLGSSKELRIDLAAAGSLPLLAELIQARSETQLSAWKLFSGDPAGPLASELAYPVPAPQTIEMPFVQVSRLPAYPDARPGFDADYLMHYSDAKTALIGWAYRANQTFIHEFVADAEERTPGCAESLIRRFSRLVDKAPETPLKLLVRLTYAGEGVERWHFDTYREIQKLIGAPDDTYTLFLSIEQLRDKRVLHLISRLHENQIRFGLLPNQIEEKIAA